MTTSSSPWPCGPEQPQLTPGVVHVWYLPLDLAEAQVDELRPCLSADEAERAARYRFDRHRRRFIACRGQVRRILAAYLSAAPGAIRFTYGARGKPTLEAPWNGSAIQFNVSNSHEGALLALTLNCELGVDVEYLDDPRDFDGLAARFFAGSEVDRLRSLSEDQRREGFFNCWTRKEAVLKAVGTGLAFPLDKVVVTLAPDEPARLVAYDDEPAATSRWWLANLAPAPGYVGALAMRGGPLELNCFRFDLSASPGRGDRI